MTTTITSNKKNQSAQVHFNSSDTITIAGNSSVSFIATDDEVITGAAINRVFAGLESGASVTITRNSELIAAFDTSGWHDYAGCGMPLNVQQAEDLTVTITGIGYAFIELRKFGSGTSQYLVG